MAVQVAIKEVASGTETAAAAKKQLMDLEQKLEAASQREALLKADVSKVRDAPTGPASTWQACCCCHMAGTCRDAMEACLWAEIHGTICSRRAFDMQARQDVMMGHAGIRSMYARAEQALIDLTDHLAAVNEAVLRMEGLPQTVCSWALQQSVCLQAKQDVLAAKQSMFSRHSSTEKALKEHKEQLAAAKEELTSKEGLHQTMKANAANLRAQISNLKVPALLSAAHLRVWQLTVPT